MQDKSEVFPVVLSGVASSEAAVAFVKPHMCTLSTVHAATASQSSVCCLKHLI